MTSSPLTLSSLSSLAQQGANLSALALIEQRAVAQALTLRSLKGHTDHPREEVMALAASVLPQGESLYMLYTETMAGMDQQPLQDLQHVSKSLTTSATALESVATKALAKGRTPTAMFAQAQGVIAARYAELMRAAQSLEACGVIPLRDKSSMESLTARPSGPLQAFYDKACAIVEATAPQHPRMRAAA